MVQPLIRIKTLMILVLLSSSVTLVMTATIDNSKLSINTGIGPAIDSEVDADIAQHNLALLTAQYEKSQVYIYTIQLYTGGF